MIDPTDEQMEHAARVSWMVEAKRAAQAPRPELTAHLYADPQLTMCGQNSRVADAVEATEHDVPCRECMDVVDPWHPAALVEGEVPMGGV